VEERRSAKRDEATEQTRRNITPSKKEERDVSKCTIFALRSKAEVSRSECLKDTNGVEANEKLKTKYFHN
jgi:hypothetical protein